MFGRKKKEVISLQISSYDCTGCESCGERCRRKVLSMVYNGNCSFAQVEYPDDCIGCGKCVSTCKAGAIELITRDV